MLLGVSTPQSAIAAPPEGCVLSDTHVLFSDDQSAAANTFVTRTYVGSGAVTVDPANTNFHIRNATVSLWNRTSHTFYDVASFSGYFGLSRTNLLSSGINWTDWSETDGTLTTAADAVRGLVAT